MVDVLEVTPQFWQGVFASVVAGILLLLLGYFGRLVSATIRDGSNARKKNREKIRGALTHGNDLEKTHASMRVLFHVLNWLFVGNILWILPESMKHFSSSGR